jgi:hypothetical protein
MNQGSYHIAAIADKIANKMRRHDNVNVSSFDIRKAQRQRPNHGQENSLKGKRMFQSIEKHAKKGREDNCLLAIKQNHVLAVKRLFGHGWQKDGRNGKYG